MRPAPADADSAAGQDLKWSGRLADNGEVPHTDPCPGSPASEAGPRARLRGRVALDAQAGFTLVEVIVAMVIIGGTLVGLMGLQVTSARTSQTSRERQQASALANQVIEQVRALDASRIRQGLDATDYNAQKAADPNLNSSGQLSYGLTTPEGVVTTLNLAAVVPLEPYVQPTASSTLDGRAYDVRAYVTSSGDADGFWVSVAVRWSDRGRAATPVLVRSYVYAPAA